MEPDARNAVAAAPAAQDVATLSLRCWGTRGSIPSPGPATAGFGGNTPCIEVRTGGPRSLIMDAGSGMRLLGLAMMESDTPVDTVVFLTHFHWDHIQGFPFFAPLYRTDSRLKVVGPMQQRLDVQSLFAGQMGPIYFPVPFSAVAAHMDFQHLNEGVWSESGITVTALRVRHPSFTVGYRVEAGARSFCYVPDNELVGSTYDIGQGWRDRFVDFCGSADLLIHDAMFTDDEYSVREGWGHSTYRQALDLAAEAGVGRLLFFHHAPERSDAALAEIVERHREDAAARGLSLDVDAAAEGAEIEFP